MRRRTALLLFGGLVTTAGCTGVSVSSDRVVLDAGETVVDEDAVTDAGYELQESGTEEINETVSPAGRDVQVIVRNHVAVYEKSAGPGAQGGASMAGVGVVTMPDASIAGQNLNPLIRMDETELLEQFAGDEAASMEFEEAETYAVETLGGEADVTVYHASTGDDDQPDAYVHLVRTSPSETDDAVLAYAMYPVQLEEMERDGVERLLSALVYTPHEDDDS